MRYLQRKCTRRTHGTGDGYADTADQTGRDGGHGPQAPAATRTPYLSLPRRDVAEVPDAILTAIHWQFYDSPIKAAILPTGVG